VTRLAAIGLFLLGLGVAGTFSGTVIADITTSTSATNTGAVTNGPAESAIQTYVVRQHDGRVWLEFPRD